MGKNYLKSSLQNASFSIVFQVVFRCLTFVLNALVLRHVSQAAVGVMNVRLLLLESTILFLSREAFRRACLSKTSEHSWAQVLNLLWVTVPLCQVLCIVFGYIWLCVLVPPSPSITEHYAFGVWVFCLSCIIEMCCEPVYLTAQAFLFVRLKIVMDVVHFSARTLTFVTLILCRPREPVVAFSIAQIMSALSYTCGYYIYFYYYIGNLKKHRLSCTVKLNQHTNKENSNKQICIDCEDDFPFHSLTDFLPAKIENQPPVNYSLARLTWSFFKQGILKQVLTEGERYVMTLLPILTFYEQGVYDIVNNLGSLAARFVFRPIEDSSYFYFSQMVARDAAITDQNQINISESANVLHQILRCISSIGLVILVFGQSYSKLLLVLYGGESLIKGPGPLLLRTHCFAVFLLGVNGITECYALATMNASQLDRYNYMMAALSIMFLLVSLGFTTLFGAVGFILANCCNMTARILHSLWFINNRYKGSQYKPLKGLVPRGSFLIMLAVAWVCTSFSETKFFEDSKIVHLAVGAVFFIAVLLVWCYEERELVTLAYGKYKARSKQE